MTKGIDTKNRASQKGSFFDPKKEAQDTMNFIGACLHNPMTPEAKENIQEWIERTLNIAYIEGSKAGYTEAFEDNKRIHEEVWGETK